MKKFIQENPTIAYGLGLPLLLVVIFLLVSGLPNLLVAKPQYEVLYATGMNNYPNVLQIAVVEQRVKVIYQGTAYGNQQRPRLWRFNPQSGGVQEIAIILPPSPTPASYTSGTPADVPHPVELEIPDLESLTVNSSSVAPDGYEFATADGRSSRNVFGGLFYSSRYNHDAVLTKSGRSVRLPNTAERYYNRNTQFVGWVVPE